MSFVLEASKLSFLTISFQMHVAYTLRLIDVQYFVNLYILLLLAPGAGEETGVTAQT